jgi:ribosomal protein S18 acetylase RimI-like enzyme
MTAFELKTHHLPGAALRPLTPINAAFLGEALAAMPPWSVIGWPAQRLIRAFQREQPSLHRFEVTEAGELAGIVTIQYPFLYGPYLQLLAILPGFQERNLGLRVLQWMESEALVAEERQLWLCVSTFNTGARAFYERFGFETVTVLEKLASDATDELLMRKRLSVARTGQ